MPEVCYKIVGDYKLCMNCMSKNEKKSNMCHQCGGYMTKSVTTQ